MFIVVGALEDIFALLGLISYKGGEQLPKLQAGCEVGIN